MSNDNASEKLHPRCPFCAHAFGRLYAVQFAADMKTLAFRCEGCRRSWEADEYVRNSASAWSSPDQRDRP